MLTIEYRKSSVKIVPLKGESWIEGKSFLPWGQKISGTCSPERLCCFHPWRFLRLCGRPDQTLGNAAWSYGCPTLSRRFDSMNLCLLLQLWLSSDDETDSTHRKLLNDIQLELRCYAAGQATLMLGEWVGRNLIKCTGKGWCLPQEQRYPMEQGSLGSHQLGSSLAKLVTQVQHHQCCGKDEQSVVSGRGHELLWRGAGSLKKIILPLDLTVMSWFSIVWVSS